jgi:hypothetical protein
VRSKTMSVRGRLASYGLVLAAAFGIGVGIGEVTADDSRPVSPVDPTGITDTTDPGHVPHGDDSP